MNMTMKSALIGLLATAYAAGAAAQAGDVTGFYFGAGVGASNVSVEDDHNNHNNDCCYYDYGYDYNTGEEATAFSLHTGYRFGPYLAVEIGYLDAGKPEWDDHNVFIPELNGFYSNHVKLDLQAAELSVLGILPFGGIWEAYVKAGGAYWWADADQRVVSNFDGSVLGRKIDDDNLDFLFALGFGVSFSPQWHVRLEYQTFNIQDQLLNTNNNSTLDSVLLELQFRPGRS
jgi:opacity protein-like surface antigen